MAPLVAGWHLPLFFMEEGGLRPSVLVGGLVTTMAMTFWYNWLFNRTGGSVLLVILAHDLEGSIQAAGWIYMGVWLAVAIGLVVFDMRAWRARARRGDDATLDAVRSARRIDSGGARLAFSSFPGSLESPSWEEPRGEALGSSPGYRHTRATAMNSGRSRR